MSKKIKNFNKNYRQTTYQTCLACCLLQKASEIKRIKITQKLELKCVNHSMRYSKDSFALGHIDFIQKRFGISPTLIKDRNKRISIDLIDRLIETQPIVRIDCFYLGSHYHQPHYIIVRLRNGDGYAFYDPWDGKEKTMHRETLERAIESLRTYIRLEPEIITFPAKPQP